MVLGVIGGVLYLNRQEEQADEETASVMHALAQLHEQTKHQTAIATAIAGRDIVVAEVMPGWFPDGLPINVLAGPDQPWIDLAPPGDHGMHPPDPIVTGPTQAGFWYNPTTGVFRARVQPQISEAETLALYNRINASALDALEEAPDPAREPLAYTPGITPTTSYASPAAEWVETAGTAELERPTGIVTTHSDTPAIAPVEQIDLDEVEVYDLDQPPVEVTRAPSDATETDQDPEPALFTEPEPAPRPTLPKTKACENAVHL